MPKTYTFGTSGPEPDVVLMFDQTYHVRRITRSVQQKLAAADKKMNEAREADADGDKLIAIMVETLDAVLEPQGDSKPAKTVLMKAWKDDLLGVDEIATMLDNLAGSQAGPT